MAYKPQAAHKEGILRLFLCWGKNFCFTIRINAVSLYFL